VNSENRCQELGLLDKIVCSLPQDDFVAVAAPPGFVENERMKYCPTCQRRFPDLISMCPTDQTTLTDTPSAAKEANPGTAAGAASGKEPVDTRTLEEKLFAPLPKSAAPAPPAAPSVRVAAPPAPKPSPGSTTKMMETVFEDAQPQKSSKMAAVTRGGEVARNKIIPATLAVVVIIAALFIFHKSSAPPAAPDANVSANSADVDMEMNLRDSLSKNAALRNQNIEIRVKGGTVILTGEASSPAKIDQAIKAVKTMAGVREVVNHLQVNPNVGVRSEGHIFSAGGLQQRAEGDATERGLAEQAKAHELALAGDRAMSHGDYKAAASFYKQALALNPEDTGASMGYTQATEKLQ
jgi:hypothetical protein